MSSSSQAISIRLTLQLVLEGLGPEGMDAITDALCHLAPDSIRTFAQELVVATSVRAHDDLHVRNQLSAAVLPLLEPTPLPQESNSPPSPVLGQAPTLPVVPPGATLPAPTDDEAQKDEAVQAGDGKDVAPDASSPSKVGGPEIEAPDAGQAPTLPVAPPGVTLPAPTDDAAQKEEAVQAGDGKDVAPDASSPSKVGGPEIEEPDASQAPIVPVAPPGVPSPAPTDATAQKDEAVQAGDGKDVDRDATAPSKGEAPCPAGNEADAGKAPPPLDHAPDTDQVAPPPELAPDDPTPGPTGVSPEVHQVSEGEAPPGYGPLTAEDSRVSASAGPSDPFPAAVINNLLDAHTGDGPDLFTLVTTTLDGQPNSRPSPWNDSEFLNWDAGDGAEGVSAPQLSAGVAVPPSGVAASGPEEPEGVGTPQLAAGVAIPPSGVAASGPSHAGPSTAFSLSFTDSFTSFEKPGPLSEELLTIDNDLLRWLSPADQIKFRECVHLCLEFRDSQADLATAVLSTKQQTNMSQEMLDDKTRLTAVEALVAKATKARDSAKQDAEDAERQKAKGKARALDGEDNGAGTAADDQGEGPAPGSGQSTKKRRRADSVYKGERTKKPRLAAPGYLGEDAVGQESDAEDNGGDPGPTSLVGPSAPLAPAESSYKAVPQEWDLAFKIVHEWCRNAATQPGVISDKGFIQIFPLSNPRENRYQPGPDEGHNQFITAYRNIQRSERLVLTRQLQLFVDTAAFMETHRKGYVKNQGDAAAEAALKEEFAEYIQAYKEHGLSSMSEGSKSAATTGPKMVSTLARLGVVIQGICSILGSAGFMVFLTMSSPLSSLGKINNLKDEPLSALSHLLRGGRPQVEGLSPEDRRSAEAAIYGAHVIIPRVLNHFLAAASKLYDEHLSEPDSSAAASSTLALHIGPVDPTVPLIEPPQSILPRLEQKAHSDMDDEESDSPRVPLVIGMKTGYDRVQRTITTQPPWFLTKGYHRYIGGTGARQENIPISSIFHMKDNGPVQLFLDPDYKPDPNMTSVRLRVNHSDIIPLQRSYREFFKIPEDDEDFAEVVASVRESRLLAGQEPHAPTPDYIRQRSIEFDRVRVPPPKPVDDVEDEDLDHPESQAVVPMASIEPFDPDSAL